MLHHATLRESGESVLQGEKRPEGSNPIWGSHDTCVSAPEANHTSRATLGKAFFRER